MAVEFEIKGLVADIEKYSQEVQRKCIEEIRVTGALIETDYKLNVPVDTGRLRSSIHTKHSDYKAHNYSDNKGQMFDGTLSIEPNDFQAVTGTNVEYATKIELSGGKVKGKNALATAFEKNTRGLPSRLAKLISE